MAARNEESQEREGRGLNLSEEGSDGVRLLDSQRLSVVAVLR